MRKITLLAAIAAFFAFNTSEAQTHFSDDFNDGNSDGWTLNDIDNDGQNWAVGDFSNGTPAIPEFSSVLCSRSWIGPLPGTAYNPNNYATSPAIDLTSASATNLFLEYDYGTIQNTTYFAEQYSVYVTTANTMTAINAATPILNETMAQGLKQSKQLNLSAYAGQTIYITFRHHDCTDMNTMIIDNVVVRNQVNEDVSLESATINPYSLVNTDNTLGLSVKNLGVNAVSSIEVNWNDGTDHISTINTTIAPGATVSVNHPTAVNYATVEGKALNVTITKVNAGADGDPSNNTKSVNFNTVDQAYPKTVVFEEGTGTWCGWCPRGAVVMDQMIVNHPNDFAGVAVHNGDPMTLTEYDSNAGFSGFPSVNIDRELKNQNVGLTEWEGYYSTQKAKLVPATMDATITGAVSNITIEAKANFKTPFPNANFRLGVILIEDGVTGTASGYAQANYYAGGGSGVMGGFEALANPVPAADMVYKHVGRALLGGYAGQAGSVPTTITNGQVVSYNFNYTVPATSDRNKMYAIVVLLDPSTGVIVNAKQFSLDPALSVDDYKTISMKVYPNPAPDNVTLEFEADRGTYDVVITDMRGRIVLSKNYSNLYGFQSLNVPVEHLGQGNYIISVVTRDASYSQILMVK